MLPSKLYSVVEWFFSKSRGPGGQNVNKGIKHRSSICTIMLEIVNTKAELRVVPAECSQFPQELKDHLPPVLIFKSDQFRTQPDNMKACIDALKIKITEAAERIAPRPTSQDQMEKVQRLKRDADNFRREQKEMRSSKKTSRSLEKSWKKDN